MAANVKVVNKNSVEYRDTYREKEIFIPAGGHIEMQRRDAIEFLGRMSPTGKDGKPIPKMLEIAAITTPTDSAPDKAMVFTCNLDGRVFDTQEELDDHLKTLSGKTVSRERIDKAKRTD